MGEREKNDKEAAVKFKSANMNYIFNVEYFDYIIEHFNDAKKNEEELAKNVNAQICSYEYPPVKMFEELKNEEGYESFVLYTTYPGLLMGSGNLHDISCKGAYKLGFFFDYVNGLPYLPGSSLKGVLRSVFPGQHQEDKEEYSSYLIGLMEELGIKHVQPGELDALEEEIFDFQDVFLGAYPDSEQRGTRTYFDSEYITPHKPLKNPNPISFLKVKAGVGMRFHFLIRDGQILSAEQKVRLFKKLILEFGIGAKTNIGFGKFAESRPKEFITEESVKSAQNGFRKRKSR